MSGLLFFNNNSIFILLEMLLICPIFLGLYKEIKPFFNRSLVTIVTRGNESWSYFVGFFAISSAIYLQIISNTELGEYKNVVTLINLLLLAHTSFRNRWFRNSIINIISRVRKWTD